MISITYGCRGTTIEFADEFSNLGIPVGTSKLIIGNTIVDSVNDRWIAADTCWTTLKFWPRANETMSLLKLQSGVHYDYACEAHWSWIPCERLLHKLQKCGSRKNCPLFAGHSPGSLPKEREVLHWWYVATVRDLLWQSKSLHQELRVIPRLGHSG